MATYKIEAFPKRVTLRDDSEIEVRPMTPEDKDKLLEFFLRIPGEDRYFLKDNITSPRVIEEWASHLDYDRALPLLAWRDGRIVGDAVLIRSRSGARSHMGELRVVVHPDCRSLGLGTALIRLLCDVASDAELEQVVIELAADRDREAISATERLGFLQRATIPEYFRDEEGRKHDLVVMVLPLGKWYEWWSF